MNVYYYLFYRISCAINRRGNNGWGVITVMSGLVSANIVLMYLKMLNLVGGSYGDMHRAIIVAICVTVFWGNYFLFLRRDRYRKIEMRYRDESSSARTVGIILTVLYVAITMGSAFI